MADGRSERRGLAKREPTGLTLLPAVDVAGGRAVRPIGGQLEPAQADAIAPMRLVADFVAGGATWIHLVDLDLAYRIGSNAALLREMIAELAATAPGVQVQVSGGIVDTASLAAALGTGAARVNLGTAAMVDLDWCSGVIAEYGERVAAGLDVRGDLLHPRGRNAPVGSLYTALDSLNRAGAARYVVTDVARDGRLTGPNLGLLAGVCAATDAAVVASGGVASLEDLRSLATLAPVGLTGAIVGRALHVGAFTVSQALEVLRAPDA